MLGTKLHLNLKLGFKLGFERGIGVNFKGDTVGTSHSVFRTCAFVPPIKTGKQQRAYFDKLLEHGS